MTRWLVLTVAGVAVAAGAQTTSVRDGTAVDRLLACRSISTPADRLACLDRESNALAAAMQRHELTLIDSADVDRSRRKMFGLDAPDHKILSSALGRPAAIPMKHDGIIRSVSALGYGHYLMTLQDGAIWRNVDLWESGPSVGAPVHIEKTPFGAYVLKTPSFIGVHAVRMR